MVRDEKGTETVRRASYLKVCDSKEKVTAVIPEHDEYKSFGRSTKLLLHTKDVPDLQFTSKTEGSSEILPETEIFIAEISLGSDKQKTVSCSDLIKESGDIPLKAEISVKETNNNLNEQYIVEYTDDQKRHSKIPLDAAASRETDKMYGKHENYTWFPNPVDCISRWSKALKLGARNSVGVESCQTAPEDSKRNDSSAFSFFL